MTAAELARDLIGRTVADARVLTGAAGLRLEVLESFIVDAMVDPSRIRVRVSDGVVEEAWADHGPDGWAPPEASLPAPGDTA